MWLVCYLRHCYRKDLVNGGEVWLVSLDRVYLVQLSISSISRVLWFSVVRGFALAMKWTALCGAFNVVTA